MGKRSHLTRVQKKEVAELANKVLTGRAEKKTHYVPIADLNLQEAMNHIILDPSSGAQGTDDQSRIGNEIQVTSVEIKGVLEPATDQVSVARLMLVQWQGIDSTVVPASPPLQGLNLTTGNIDAMCAFYETSSRVDNSLDKRYKVIYDETFYFDTHNAGARRPWDLKVSGKVLLNKGHFTYSEETLTTYSDPLVLYGFGIDTASTLRYATRVKYVDV